ncbi:hypothetical protein [Hydrogenimonas sp.]
MKGIETAAAESMALLARYEPLTIRFSREILGRRVRVRNARPAVRLLFAKLPRPMVRQSFSHTKRILRFDTRLDLRVQIDRPTIEAPSRASGKSEAPRLLSRKGESTRQTPPPVARSLYVKSPGPAASAAPRAETAAVASRGVRPLLIPLAFRERIGPMGERVVERWSKERFETERVVERQRVGKGAEGYRTPAPLHYRASPSAAEPAPAGTAKEPVRTETETGTPRREEVEERIAKQLTRYRREQIETISEKVYTLVMQKWEKERRRRGVLYE